MSSANTIKSDQINLVNSGQGTVVILTDTTEITGNFTKIQVLSNAVFTTLTSNITKNGIVTASVAADFGTVSAGTILLGKFTTIKLTSGTVILFG